MSSTTELLLEEIVKLESNLLEARLANDPVKIMSIEVKLSELKKHFAKANETLIESRSVLKG
jgi:hypothetical protein